MKSINFIEKYDRPGPRYTSYPTVPYWENNPTEEQWIQSLEDSLKNGELSGIGAAIYIHIPFCESLCTYCGCNTRITRNHDVGAPYVSSIINEFNLYKNRLPIIAVQEIHLGGGTPTFLNGCELQTLMEPILNGVKVIHGAEFSVEADPRVTTLEHLRTLSSLGFKRLSLGIQDFAPVVQKAVHREQSPEQVQQVCHWARECGFTSINYDLIYGLPFQTQESVAKTIEKVISLRPDRIAFYSYAHVPWIKPGQRRFTEGDLPQGVEKRKLYELGRSFFEGAGYLEIGMDHFSLPSDSLWKAHQEKTLHRNFMGYITKHVAPLIGLGVSAISDSWRVFVQNEKLLENYQNRVSEGRLPLLRGHILNDEDQILRRHILNLMTKFKTEWSETKDQTGFLDSISSGLEEFCRDGLIELTDKGCQILEAGRPFLRNICMAFDARLIRKKPQFNIFSKTV